MEKRNGDSLQRTPHMQLTSSVIERGRGDYLDISDD